MEILSVEPWWAKYLAEILFFFFVTVILPPFMVWRSKLGTREQNLLDSGVKAFNHTEQLARVVSAGHAPLMVKADKYMELAVEEYEKRAKISSASESDKDRLSGIAESLVYDQNIQKLAQSKLSKIFSLPSME